MLHVPTWFNKISLEVVIYYKTKSLLQIDVVILSDLTLVLL